MNNLELSIDFYATDDFEGAVYSRVVRGGFDCCHLSLRMGNLCLITPEGKNTHWVDASVFARVMKRARRYSFLIDSPKELDPVVIAMLGDRGPVSGMFTRVMTEPWFFLRDMGLNLPDLPFKRTTCLDSAKAILAYAGFKTQAESTYGFFKQLRAAALQSGTGVLACEDFPTDHKHFGG